MGQLDGDSTACADRFYKDVQELIGKNDKRRIQLTIKYKKQEARFDGKNYQDQLNRILPV